MRRTTVAALVSAWASVACISCAGAPDADADIRPTLLAEETIRIGSVDDPATSLTDVGALELTSGGRIVTLHPQSSEGRIHARDGALVTTFGGEGDGPGEFSTPSRLGILDGAIWVYDRGARRFSYFDLDGRFERDERFEGGAWGDELVGPPGPYGKLSDGAIHGAPSVASASVASGEVTSMPEVTMRLDGTVIDTVLIRPLGGDQLTIELPQGGLYGRQPFSDSRLLTVSPWRQEVLDIDRELRPDVGTFHVTKRAIAGDTLWSRSYTFDPVPLPAAAADSFVDGLAEQLDGRIPLARGELETRLRDALFVPDHLPAVRRVIPGRDGSIWLETGARIPDTTRWLVLDPEGEIHGEVDLSDRFTLLNASLQDVWGQLRDDLDVPYIVGYAIRPAVPGEGR